MPDFLPRQESKLAAWLRNFDQKIYATPEAFGLRPQWAAEHHALYLAFAEAYRVVSDPGTRTIPAIVGKDAAKAALLRRTRGLSKIVRGTNFVTDAQRIELGLRPRATPSRVARPATAPWVNVVEVRGSRVRIRLKDPASPTRKAKARGITGATIFTHVGDQPPSRREDWRYYGGTSRTETQVNFGSRMRPGEKVWIICQWNNRRSEAGPLSAPTYAYIQFGEMQMPTTLKPPA